MKLIYAFLFLILLPLIIFAQQKDSFIVEGKDTTIIIDKGTFTLKAGYCTQSHGLCKPVAPHSKRYYFL